ncbi:hypothetical protein [Streptomyces syringium]|uniref:hypothetical protein n=1 Tax=Streptomyces syringium TaxID=76729 RepID=UPI0033D0E36A
MNRPAEQQSAEVRKLHGLARQDRKRCSNPRTAAAAREQLATTRMGASGNGGWRARPQGRLVMAAGEPGQAVADMLAARRKAASALQATQTAARRLAETLARTRS